MPYDSDDATAQEGHPSVVAYRLLQVENGLDKLVDKVDNIANNYPTTAMLSVILDPIKQDIRNIEAERRAEKAQKSSQSAQLKIALIAAGLSPIVSIILALIVATGEGVK